MSAADFPDLAARAMELAPHAPRAGFRLHQVEVFNWGTFHERVWRLPPAGDSILLTGDIGSGKSTLVDALTTLLVPSHKVSYNKAAGADARERSLRSYVLGHYRSERSDTGAAARAVALRDHNSYSVLLAVFANEVIGETITLAQVFWSKDPRGQPERVYLVAEGRLSIAEHFTGFGADIGQLRKRLRGMPGVALHDSFLPYGAEFRRRFGIGSEQALDLFHQAISMKSVGNLTDFVREHMLEPFPVEARVAALIANFADLHRAHDAVLKARAQIDRLVPLAEECERYAAMVRQCRLWRDCRAALRPWIADLKGALLDQRIARLSAEIEAAADSVANLAEQRRSQRAQRDALIEAMASNGGHRIGQIGSELARLESVRDERMARAEQYARVAEAVGLPGAPGAGTFAGNRQAIAEGQASCARRRDDFSNRLTEAGVTVRELGRQHGELTAELEVLRRGGSNIPRRMIEARGALCDALRIAPDTLPFAGELIQVQDQERAWIGAAERVLRDFAVSLLVPDVHFDAVAAWASRAHTGVQLRFHRVRAAQGTRLLHPQSLVHKLAIKSDSPYRQWLIAELEQRFDYACCDDAAAFRREKLALSRSGQAKAPGERYEQDDRYPVDDRAHFVLGWSNEAKVAALTKQERDLAARVQGHLAQVRNMKRDLDEQNALLGYWQQLALYRSFRELDWKAPVGTIEQLQRERQALATSTGMLGELQRQFDALRLEQDRTDAALDEAARMQARLAEQLAQARRAQADCARPEAAPDGAARACADELERIRQLACGEDVLTVDSCERTENLMRDALQARIDEDETNILPLRDTITGAMQEFARAWPLDTREVDVSIDAAAEFRRMLDTLQTSDLPRFLQRFQELLNEKTVREIAGFQSQLQRDRETVRERIADINGSLHVIDYNPGRYIALEAAANLDAELRDFQQDLRACTEGELAGSNDEASLEAKFLQVKRIIERFRGREGSVEMDQRWTRKVTDVRKWFVFSASERSREDGSEQEHYTDAAGKSGGQKEKLAYTVLAAGLACQFGLEREGERARSFRFAVIDEAFGRGSDDSARYGLELFSRMNLQLLIVTPLQKIHVIEPYVTGLGFVHSEEGRQSMLRYLSIGEYQTERASRLSEV